MNSFRTAPSFPGAVFHNEFDHLSAIRKGWQMLLKVSDVAKRLNCSVSTVYGLIERDLLPHHRCPGIRVSEEQINAYLESVQRGPVAKRDKPRPAHRPRLRDLVLD